MPYHRLIVFSKPLARLASGRRVEYADEGPGRLRNEKAARVAALAVGIGLVAFGGARLLVTVV